jgi:hypothetical protein
MSVSICVEESVKITFLLSKLINLKLYKKKYMIEVKLREHMINYKLKLG